MYQTQKQNRHLLDALKLHSLKCTNIITKKEQYSYYYNMIITYKMQKTKIKKEKIKIQQTSALDKNILDIQH